MFTKAFSLFYGYGIYGNRVNRKLSNRSLWLSPMNTWIAYWAKHGKRYFGLNFREPLYKIIFIYCIYLCCCWYHPFKCYLKLLAARDNCSSQLSVDTRGIFLLLFISLAFGGWWEKLRFSFYHSKVAASPAENDNRKGNQEAIFASIVG